MYRTVIFVEQLEYQFLCDRRLKKDTAIILYRHDAERDAWRVFRFISYQGQAHGVVGFQDVLHHAQPFDFDVCGQGEICIVNVGD